MPGTIQAARESFFDTLYQNTIGPDSIQRTAFAVAAFAVSYGLSTYDPQINFYLSLGGMLVGYKLISDHFQLSALYGKYSALEQTHQQNQLDISSILNSVKQFLTSQEIEVGDDFSANDIDGKFQELKRRWQQFPKDGLPIQGRIKELDDSAGGRMSSSDTAIVLALKAQLAALKGKITLGNSNGPNHADESSSAISSNQAVLGDLDSVFEAMEKLISSLDVVGNDSTAQRAAPSSLSISVPMASSALQQSINKAQRRLTSLNSSLVVNPSQSISDIADSEVILNELEALVKELKQELGLAKTNRDDRPISNQRKEQVRSRAQHFPDSSSERPETAVQPPEVGNLTDSAATEVLVGFVGAPPSSDQQTDSSSSSASSSEGE